MAESIHDRQYLLRRQLVSFKVSQIPHRFTDVLILGSGVAGLSAALEASRDLKTEVLLVAKDQLDETGTNYAQGGIAAVLEPAQTGDSVESHIQDTLTAADGLADEEAVRVTVVEGVARVRELIELGAAFDRDAQGRFHFTLEGGHAHPRILHRGDTSGQEIERVLLESVLERPNVTVLGHTFGVDLLSREGGVMGAILSRPNGELEAAWSSQTILATGGAGRLYRETTNPRISTGDGVAMAFRAGAVLQDIEFIQFHPTTLYIAGADRFLITEAVRGEGGVLRDGAGNRFMHKYHPLGDLAPRDVVSRSIVTTMRERGDNKVYLDLSAIPPERIRLRFPRILEILGGFGIDILREPIPVRPSAHYSIGGVRTDLWARTSLPGLYAAGEVASTGLHGANRLASNSLLEGLVFGHRAGREARGNARGRPIPEPFSVSGSLDPTRQRSGPKSAAIDHADLISSLRSLIWLKVGLERNGAELTAALQQIRSWIPYVMGSDFRDVQSWTVQNMILMAYLLTLAGLRREESRGVHYRTDHPKRDDAVWQQHMSLSQADIPGG
ncbi:MAG TPA: L-aspartate oxidase [Planctomycetota bacterium]|nr:L-aspartate oxidase [Planctomycetota bacterium]